MRDAKKDMAKNLTATIVAAQGPGKHHVLGGNSPSALANSGHETLETTGVYGDLFAQAKSDHDTYVDLKLLAKLVLDVAGISGYPTIKHGRVLLEKQLASAHILKLDDLKYLSPKIISEGLKGAVEMKNVAAITLLSRFAYIDDNHHVLSVLDIKQADLTAKTVKFVVRSHEQILKVKITAEDFKSVSTFNDVNILSVVEGYKQILYDFGMEFLLDKNAARDCNWDQEAGQHFFENALFMRIITHRNRRSSGSHLLANAKGSGINAFRSLVAAYLPAEKIGRLLGILETQLKDLRLLRLRDVHIFFSVVSWIIKSIIELGDDQWTKNSFTAPKILQILNSSSTELNSNKEGILSMTLQQGPVGTTDVERLESVSNKLYQKHSDSALTKHSGSLPPGFFPDYTQVNRYTRDCKDIKAGKEPAVLADLKSKATKLRALTKIAEENARKRGPEPEAEAEPEEVAAPSAQPAAHAEGGQRKKKKRNNSNRKGGNK